MQLRFRPTRRAARGYALAELLLATVIIGYVTVYQVLPAIREQQRDTRATAVADSQVSFQQLATTYFYANESALRSAMNDGTSAGTYCRLGVDYAAADPSITGLQVNSTTNHTCAIDMALLKWKGIAPTTMLEVNPWGQRWVAIYKMGTSAASVSLQTVEMLSLGVVNVTGITDYAPGGNAQTETELLLRAATKVGASGGYVPNGDVGLCDYTLATSKYEACSSQGQWKVDVSTFVN